MESITSSTWSNSKKILFRFLFIYLILYTSPFPLSIFFGGNWIGTTYGQFWVGPVAWVGKHLLAIDYEITVLPNGSGDTTFNYVQVFTFFVVAICGTLFWSILDRKRPHYEKLLFWLTVFIRYYLAITMLGYGFAKVIKTQFPFPFPDKLLQPVGELSPMGLLWTFMGYSKAYTIFAGLGEVLGGFFLFFRRTTLLGALILSIVMINVVILNFSYDVPVKLFSCHLLFISLFLIAPYGPRIWRFLVLHEAVPLQPVFTEPRKRIVLLVIKILLIGFVVLTEIISGIDLKQQLNDMASESGNSDIYNVETFVMRGDTVPAILNNNVRWKRVLVIRKGWAAIEYMDGVTMNLPFASDTTRHTIKIGKGYIYDFNYSPIDSTHVLWRGLMGLDSLKIIVEKKKLVFPLVNRNFHWINEYPFK